MSCYSVERRVLALLPKCTFEQLRQIHSIILTSSLILHSPISSAFLRRSTEHGEMNYAARIFAQMGSLENRDVTIWNAMIRGYAFNGPLQRCLSLFDQMTQRGLQPNNFTYPFVISVLSQLGLCAEAKQVHCRVVKTGFESNYAVSNSLFDMYFKTKDGLFDARRVFDEMCCKPVESWNRLIDGYGKIEQVESARRLFENMPEKDDVSWNTMISAYARVKDVESATHLFERMPEKNEVSWTSMIGVYGSLGDLDTARAYFDQMPLRNVVSWNSLISCHTQCGKFEEALQLFVQMITDGLSPDGFTFVSVLSACAHLGDLQLGKWIHYLLGDGVQFGVEVRTALMDMYGKCGDVGRAFTIFIKIGNKDIFCWNIMIKSLAIHSRVEDSIELFQSMRDDGLMPNSFTFASVLFACSHGGYVDTGRKIFYSMERDFSMHPELEHYGCFVDLLCRNGLVEEAFSIVRSMTEEPDIPIWGTLLGGCKLINNFNLAQQILACANDLKINKSGLYVLLSNMHAAADHWSEALLARKEMEDNKIRKEIALSSLI
uniref:Chlororespiratory reduction 4 n=1 Tax=Kalanchoe fedtschenkoi TaxID=63787 RepID=A0A7N0ZVL6_KALFE